MRFGLVIYGDLDQTSGGFRYDRKLVDYLRTQGDTVEVISLPWRAYWRNVAAGFSPTIKKRLDKPFDVLLQDELCHPSLWRVNRRLTRPGATVALVHHIQSDDQRGRLGGLRRSVERQYLDSVDGWIATSDFTRQRAQAVAATSPDESVVAPPAGRAEGRAVDESAVSTRATEEPFRILYLGNIVARKGLLTLLSALGSPDIETTDWQLTVVGGEPEPAYAEQVRKRAAKREIDERVDFVGEVSDAELTAQLEASHVLCVPSRYEGFGMVYLEAMEYGVVPIATTNGGASEFILDGENGALVNPGDVDRIATLIAEWAADRQQLANLGVAALQTAAAHPSWDESLAQVRSLLVGLSDASTEDGTFAAEKPNP